MFKFSIPTVGGNHWYRRGRYRRSYRRYRRYNDDYDYNDYNDDYCDDDDPWY